MEGGGHWPNRPGFARAVKALGSRTERDAPLRFVERGQSYVARAFRASAMRILAKNRGRATTAGWAPNLTRANSSSLPV
jgi:hypothetical protein